MARSPQGVWQALRCGVNIGSARRRTAWTREESALRSKAGGDLPLCLPFHCPPDPPPPPNEARRALVQDAAASPPENAGSIQFDLPVLSWCRGRGRCLHAGSTEFLFSRQAVQRSTHHRRVHIRSFRWCPLSGALQGERDADRDDARSRRRPNHPATAGFSRFKPEIHLR